MFLDYNVHSALYSACVKDGEVVWKKYDMSGNAFVFERANFATILCRTLTTPP